MKKINRQVNLKTILKTKVYTKYGTQSIQEMVDRLYYLENLLEELRKLCYTNLRYEVTK